VTVQEKVLEMKDGLELLMNYCHFIALLPIGEWLDSLNHAEAVALLLGPTASYMEHAWGRLLEITERVLRASLELKRVVQELQPLLIEEMIREQERKLR
jgi:hypothetical protein